MIMDQLKPTHDYHNNYHQNKLLPRKHFYRSTRLQLLIMLKKHLLNYQESCNHCSIGCWIWLAMLEQLSRQWVQMKQPKHQTLVKDGIIIIKCWFHKKKHKHYRDV